MPKPKFTGKKIPPAWTKHAKGALPDGANVIGVGRKRKTGERMIKFTTRRGRVTRAALLEGIRHKAGRLPKPVMEALEANLPRGATDAQVTRRGNKYRLIYEMKGKAYSVFLWEHRTTTYKVHKPNTLKDTRITRAKPHVRGRTVKRVIVE